jgi:hypothetical protein
MTCRMVTEKQDRQCMCDITLCHVGMVIITMETKQCGLYVLLNTVSLATT